MKALILVDLQNDFVPGGALSVPDGDKMVPIANRLSRKLELVIATQDWHPANHGSFASNYPGKSPGDVVELNGLQQILWPDHCVQQSRGAAFVDAFDTGPVEKIFQKGTDPGIDSYSAMFDNGHLKSTGLAEYLKERGVKTVYLAGLATDYCVRFTALDALGEGFETVVIEDGCRGVNLQPGDVEKAIEEIREAGGKIVSSAEV